MHPWCRSTTIADFGEDTLKGLERRAKDADGNTVRVPASQSYEEWYRQFVENKNSVFALAESIDKPAKSGIIKTEHKANTEFHTKSGSNLFDISRKEAMVNSEKKIAANDYETAIIFSMDGKREFDFTNGECTITFTESALQRIPPGAVITHNHPNGTVPSPEDVAFLLNRDISEIRACNKCGAYVMRKTPEWDNLNLKLEDIAKEFYGCSNDLAAEYNELAAKEGKSIFDYLCEIDERSWKSFCDNHGLEFMWEERK